ncbi:MAG: apolipoprotein N-acyltransferase [Thermodesulfovibrionales bacterium]|nr:apolipoprotein N-acyltransferase [Thermodesulfovibrionales bacterium]
MFLSTITQKIKNFFTNYLLFFLTGFFLIFSFPKFDLYFIPWFVFIPVLITLYDKKEGISFKAGFLLGLVYFFGTTYWIYHALYVYGSIPYLVSILIVLLLSSYLSLYTAFFCMLYSNLIKNTNIPALILAPTLWTSLEFIRSYLFTGFPWASLGYSQYKFLPLIQFADITGIYGVSFIILSFNGLIADIFFIKKLKDKKPLFSLSPILFSSICLLIIAIMIFSYGFYKISQDRDGSYIKVAIVQGSIDQDKKWDLSYQNMVLNTYENLTLKTNSFSPDLVVWPETALPFIFGDDKALTNRLISFQKELNSYLLFGSILIRGTEGKKVKLSNSAVLLNKNGNISYIYDKIRLVPFGEYVPLKSFLFFIDKLVYGMGDYTPGDSYLRAITPFGTFATLICYEIIFPGMVRKFFIEDGDFIVTITNDAWFGYTNGPYQHFSMAVFRAIENRKPIIRAANSGVSGYINSNGKILNTSNLFERTFLVKELKKDKTKTFYTRYGDIFSYLCLILSFVFYFSSKKNL